MNESTEITSSVSNIDSINHNGIGVNYEKDYSDEIKNSCNYINNSNVNKSSLNEYKLSQYIASPISNDSSTQFGETSLLNVRTNLDFESVSTLKDERKRILNENCLKRRHLKSNILSKVNSKLIAIPHGTLCESQQIGKIDLFKLSSQIWLSSSSGSNLSSSSDRMFAYMKNFIALTIILTPECKNINVDYTSDNRLNNSDASNSGFTHILKE